MNSEVIFLLGTHMRKSYTGNYYTDVVYVLQIIHFKVTRCTDMNKYKIASSGIL